MSETRNVSYACDLRSLIVLSLRRSLAAEATFPDVQGWRFDVTTAACSNRTACTRIGVGLAVKVAKK